ncbi:MAG: hypothetical protein ACP5NG_01290 [Conexivisphaera sp.]
MTGKHREDYVICKVCKQRVRGDKFERHALLHWITSSTDKSFREFYSELRKEAEAVSA